MKIWIVNHVDAFYFIEAQTKTERKRVESQNGVLGVLDATVSRKEYEHVIPISKHSSKFFNKASVHERLYKKGNKNGNRT